MVSKYALNYGKENQEIYKKAPKKHPTRGVVVFEPKQILGVDLVDYSKESINNKYILNAIDGFSRKAYAVPMKEKTSTAIQTALSKVFKENKPDKIWVDKEAGIISKATKDFLKKNDVDVYHTHNNKKVSIVERFNRTEKEKLEQGGKSVSNLNKFVKAYNSAGHSAFKNMLSPNDAMKNENFELANQFNMQRVMFPRKNINQSLKVGDKVRIKLEKGVFTKGYAPTWSKEIFTIIKITDSNPKIYEIKDKAGEVIEGTFTGGELQKTDL